MNTFKYLVTTTLFSLLMANAAQAADHGYITSEPEDHPTDQVFRVNIESVNGKEALSENTRAPVGENTVVVSLVFNSSWGVGMQETQDRIYTKTMKLQVEKGKTYFLGAKVDTAASPEAQREGSFWEPVVVESKGH
jgi:hypothetical protein